MEYIESGITWVANDFMNKLISVIVPIYQGKRYIDSIISMVQLNISKFHNLKEHSIELIFVNDYPQDPLILPQIEDDICDLLLVELDKNRGIHGARVEGLKRASGRYILFLDQDDKIEPTYLLSQWSNIGCCDAIICNGVYKSNRSVHVVYSKKNPPDIISHLWRHYFLGNPIPSPGHVLLQKKAISPIWISEIMEKNGADDWLLWLLMIKEKKQFKFNPEVLFIHSYNGKNVSKQYDQMYQSVTELISILKKSRKFNLFERKLLQHENEYAYVQNMKDNSFISQIRFWDKKLFRSWYETIYIPGHMDV